MSMGHNVLTKIANAFNDGLSIILGTSKKFSLKNGSGTEKFSVDDSGNVIAAGTMDVTGALTGTSVDMGTGSIDGGTISAVTLLLGANIQLSATNAVTATTGGGTTGLIPANASYVEVTSDDANKQISLPAATVGDMIRIYVGATGCELISAVAAHKVNNVTVGATNELALAANTLYQAEYVVANTWVVTALTNVGAPKLMTTTQLTSITHTAPGTPDYAIQDLTQTTPFGFVTKDEGNTLLSVVLNLQQRVAQLETASALIPDAL